MFGSRIHLGRFSTSPSTRVLERSLIDNVHLGVDANVGTIRMFSVGCRHSGAGGVGSIGEGTVGPSGRRVGETGRHGSAGVFVWVLQPVVLRDALLPLSTVPLSITCLVCVCR